MHTWLATTTQTWSANFVNNPNAVIGPAWTVTNINSYYTASPVFDIDFQSIYLTATTLSARIKVQPITSTTM